MVFMTTVARIVGVVTILTALAAMPSAQCNEIKGFSEHLTAAESTDLFELLEMNLDEEFPEDGGLDGPIVRRGLQMSASPTASPTAAPTAQRLDLTTTAPTAATDVDGTVTSGSAHVTPTMVAAAAATLTGLVGFGL